MQVFIKPLWSEEEFKDVGIIDGNTTIIADDTSDNQGFIHYSVGKFEFHITITKRMGLRIEQLLGLKKKPKITYKTIKHHCAKRNK